MKRIILVLTVVLFSAGMGKAFAGDLENDTVWTKKTDQSAGIFQVKFSPDDSMIWAIGLTHSLFFDTETGEELNRIPGKHGIFFIKNGDEFLRISEDFINMEIWDTKEMELTDTIKNEDTFYGAMAISKDEKILLATIPNGLRVWNLESKEVINTKIFEEEANLIYFNIDVLQFLCENNKFLMHLIKTWEDPEHPGDEQYYSTYGNYIVADINSLDSIDSYFNSRGTKVSPNCTYLAAATGDKDYGVELYDFQSKELLHQIPINGPSLTGIEFSPDDKFLVTSNDPGANCLKIWSTETGEEVYDYPKGSWGSIHVSHNSRYIVTGSDRYIFLLNAKWQGNPVEDPIEAETIIYPNPTTGTVTLTYSQPTTEATNIYITDIEGNYVKEILNGILEEGELQIAFDVNDLVNGSYYVIINNAKQNKIMKLIVEK